MSSRNLIETQKKLIKKEIGKTKTVISNKIVLFKKNKTVTNFALSGLV